jgi:PAS domain S-box-containing protein
MRAFKLTRYFSLISLILLILAGGVLGWLVRQQEIAQMQLVAEGLNVDMTQAMGNLLRHDIDTLMVDAAGKSKAELQSLPASKKLLDKITPLIRGTDITKVKIYIHSGMTIFSTETAQIGEDKSTNAGFLAARNGHVVSELTHRHQFSAFEGVVQNVDLMSSYVPVFNNGRVVAVFEQYQDVTRLLGQIKNSLWQVGAIIIAVLGALYLMLLLVVRHAQSVLSAQEAKLEASNHELEQSSAELAESLSLIEATLDATDNGILVVDNQGRVVSSNRRFAQMWRIPQALLATRDNQKVLQHVLDQLTDPEHFLKKVQALNQQPKVVSRDRLMFRDGRVFDRISHPHVLNETVIGRVWSFLDVTEQYRAESRVRQLSDAITEELERSEQQRSQLHSLLISIPDLVWMKDSEGVYLSCNPAFERLTGAKTAEIVGKSDLDFFPQEVAAAFRSDDRMAFESSTPIVREEWVTFLDDGHRSLLETVKTAVHDKNGKVLGVLGIARDITRMRALLDELEQARNDAQQSSAAKSSFLANMSHEIRTPMNAIIGMSELCLETSLTPKQRNYLVKIKGASDSLLRIINDILDFSKIEAGKLDMESLPFVLEDVLDGLTNLLAKKAEEQGVELTYDVDIGVEEMLIGDHLRLGQVLTNLLSNALKFSVGGTVVVQIRTLSRSEGEVELQFSVSDQGIGLTLEQQGQLFQAFTQADASTTRRFGGTGLGLAICKHLVKLMRGRIWVESEYGQGSTFHFTARFGVQELGQRRGLAMLVENLRGHAGRKVLVVDDNAIARRVLAAMLGQLGLEADCADSGEAALAQVRNGPPEGYLFCLVDLKMPGINGIATISSLRAQLGDGRTPPMLLVTAFSQDEALRGSNVPIDGFLIKPTSAKHIYAEVAPALGLPELTGPAILGRRSSDRAGLSAFRGADVLLVEDVEVNQEVIRGLLENAGLNVRVANNGEEALRVVAEKRPDCILMDCQMPVMDGFEATRRLRADAAYSDLPIVAITANAMSSDREKCLLAGMNAHVSKPINVSEFYATLALWMKPVAVAAAAEVAAVPGGVPLSSTALLEVKDIPELAGVDTAVGLAQVMGNIPLYFKVLKKFRDTLGRNFAQDFNQAIARGELDMAVRLTHSMKGVSRTLGAYPLGELVAELEDAVRASDSPLVEERLSPVIAELERVMRGLENIDEPGRKAPEQASLSRHAIFNQLASLLRERDTAASECLPEFELALDTADCRADGMEIVQAIDRYDFALALTRLQALATRMQVDLDGLNQPG